MSEKTICFDSVIFDKEEKTFTVLDGSVGTYSYKEIRKCKVMAEDARYRGTSAPFSHAEAVGGYTLTPRYVQPDVYVGLLVEMKDKTKLVVYVSKDKIKENTATFKKDKKEAEAILKIFDACIRKYK